jgi:hypothetical protein
MAQRYTAQEVADAIIETKGFITYTAKKLGCDRKTVYRYIERYDICQQAVTDARAGFLDMAEMTLHNKILDGDVTATIFALKTIGKERGYTERHEHSGADGNSLKIEFVYPDEITTTD